MAKKSRKNKRFIRLPLLFYITVGLIGWYYTKSVTHALIIVGIVFLLFISLKIWWKLKKFLRLRKAGIKEIDEMTGEEFEEFLGRLFKKRGFKVFFTKASGDYGADLILKDREGIIAVQAKRYSSTVGVKAVQEVIGALKMYDATEAWVITNNYFTKQAQKLAETNDVYLIDRDELIEMILDTK